jgi:beta-phosphoglucomutase
MKEVDMVKGIIFDFNGTLFFDTDLQEEAWRVLFKKYKGRDLGLTEFQDFIHGRVNSDIMDYFFGNSASLEKRIQLMIEKEQTYRQIVRTKNDSPQFVKGAVELFDELQRRNIKFTIATASEISNVEFYFEVFPLKKWLSGPEAILYDNGTFPGKPAPDIYQRAAALIGEDPKDCMVVEDSLSGLRAAQDAGIGRIIAMRPEKDSEIIRQDQKIEAIIDDFTDFAERFL